MRCKGGALMEIERREAPEYKKGAFGEMNMLKGVLPALVTPMDKEGNIKTELAEALVDLYIKQQADGLYMLGWTGEGACLSKEKRMQWTEAVLDAAKGRLPVLVHVGYNSNLDDSVALAEHAAERGAYAVSSVGISQTATLQDNVDYFKRISEAAPGIPFYIYWVEGGRTLTGGDEIRPAEILDAMKAVPTFAGIKFTDTNFYVLERFKKHAPDINILTGVEEVALCAQLMGADGNIGALQAVTCFHYKQMWKYMEEGNYRKAREMQYRANEVAEAYRRVDIGNMPGIKFLLKEIYDIDAGYCAPAGPFANRVVSGEGAEYLKKVFRENILITS